MTFEQSHILEDGGRVELIHYAVNAEGREVIACVPRLRELASRTFRPLPWQRTGEPGAVTCPSCRVTDAYRRGSLPAPDSAAPLVAHWSVDGVPACGAGLGARTGEVRAVTCQECRATMSFGTAARSVASVGSLASAVSLTVHYSDADDAAVCGARRPALRTGEVRSVTCKSCRLTASFQRHKALVAAALAARRAVV